MRFQRNPLHVHPAMALVYPAVDQIFESELTRLGDELRQIVVANHKLGGHPNAFTLDGLRYSIVKTYFLRGEKIPEISPSLDLRARNWIASQASLEHDHKRVLRGLSVILSKTRNRQEIRDAIPETLIQDIHELKGMERHEPYGQLLEAYPTLRVQYEEAIDMLMNYRANQLIY